MIREIKLVLLAIILSGLFVMYFAFTAAAAPRASEIVDCNNPQGYEYICYNDAECSEYLSGYSAVFTMKVEQHHEKHPVIWMNLYYDHKDLYLYGKIEGELRNGKWFMKMWTAIYDSECNLLKEDYNEGFRKKKE